MTLTYMKRLLDPWTEPGFVNRFSDYAALPGRPVYPAVNVWLNGDDAELSAEIPGIDRESIDITVSGDTVTLQGRRSEEELIDGDTYYRREIMHGDFCKSIRLPFLINADKVEATYKKGVLKVRLLKAETEKAKSIKIASE